MPTQGSAVLTDLVPGSSYAVAAPLSHVELVSASSEGVAVASLRGTGDLAFGSCPPTPGAGAGWRSLCAAAVRTWSVLLPLGSSGR